MYIYKNKLERAIEFIRLESNQLEEIKLFKKYENIKKYFKLNNTLKKITIYKESISDEFVNDFAMHVLNNNKLEVLNFNYFAFEDISYVKLYNALLTTDSAKEFKIDLPSGTPKLKFNEEVLDSFLYYITNSKKLECFKFDSYLLSSWNCDRDITSLIVKAMINNTSLKNISLIITKHDKESYYELKELISKHPSLENISLNFIYQEEAVEGLDGIFEAIANNNKIVALKLENYIIPNSSFAEPFYKMIEQTKSLKSLVWTGNFKEKDDLINFAEALSKNSSIESFVIDYSRGLDKPCSIENFNSILFNALISNKKISHVESSYQELSVNDILILANLIENNNNLKAIKLGEFQLDIKSSKAIEHALSKNYCLEDFHLRADEFLKKHIIRKWFDDGQSEKEVKEQENDFNCNNALNQFELLQFIDNIIKRNTTYAKNNEKTLASDTSLLKPVTEFVQAREVLRLVKNKEGLPENINLNGAYLTLAEFELIFRAIGLDKNVKSLSLRCSNLGNNGMKILQESISQRDPISNIQYLDLSFSEIDDVGADFVAKLISRNEIIKTLIIDEANFDLGSRNYIEDIGAELIAKALANNYTITKLSLNGQYPSNQSWEEIKEYLARNSNIQNRESATLTIQTLWRAYKKRCNEKETLFDSKTPVKDENIESKEGFLLFKK